MKSWCAAIVVCLFSLPLLGNAENVTGVQPLASGGYLLQIDGKNYVALDKADLDQLKEMAAQNVAMRRQLEAANTKLAQYQTLAAQYEELRGNYVALTGDFKTLSADAMRLNGDYAAAANKLVGLNQNYSALVKDYDSLTEKYRNVALRSQPREAFDVGLGAVSVDHQTNGVVMVGAGTHLFNVPLRGWLFGGPHTYGVMLGSSF